MCVFFLSVEARGNDWTLQSGVNRKNDLMLQLSSFNAEISTADRQKKYQKMTTSPLTFYRGTAHLYYSDLDRQQVIAASAFSHVDAVTWLQGDMHMQNYGAFDDDTGTVVFDLNDFDESWVDSYLYDAYRNAGSLVLVADEQGFNSPLEQQQIVDAFSESYLDTVDSYRNNDNEKNAKITQANAYGILDEFLLLVSTDNSRKKMLNKWTNDLGSQRYFDLSYGKLSALTSVERAALTTAINQYYLNLSSKLSGNSAYFTVLDVARRINAGTGSLGTTRYYVLIEGDSTSDNDDRILDVKLQGMPSMFPYLSSTSQQNLLKRFSASEQGCRVVSAQKALLTDVDDHLGCTTINRDSYSVREVSSFKDSFDTTALTSMTRFVKLAQQWGTILATAHARSDKDFDASLVAYQFENVMDSIANHRHAEFRAEVFAFSSRYAEQVAIDFTLFNQLLAEGLLN